MRRFSSIEPVGILNAWTTNVRMNSARMTATTIDSKYSRIVDFLKSVMTARSLRPGSHLQDGEKGLLRDLDLADPLHPLLAFLLLLEQLALAGDVAAVALGEHVLAHRADVLPRDHASPDRGLDRHLELLPRDQLLELAGQHHAIGVRRVAVHDRR